MNGDEKGIHYLWVGKKERHDKDSIGEHISQGRERASRDRMQTGGVLLDIKKDGGDL